MPIGYLGYAKLANQFLLTNSSSLNRKIEPLYSEAVWGAGWYNAAKHTNYADSQQYFEGGLEFELQAQATVWNLIRSWLIEDRACSQSLVMSPNGFVVYDYTKDTNDSRTGVWLKSASFSIDAEQLIKVSAECIALKRTETVSQGKFCANMRSNPANGAPVNPLNPAPRNRNPIPGWNAAATIVWPDSQPFWSTPSNLTGMVLKSASINVNNNTQLIKGCTGDANPVAVIQGTITAEGDMSLWREGGIPDPYATPGVFTASNANIAFSLGGAGGLTFRMNYVVLTSDAHDIQGQDTPTTRNFGFAGLGDGISPPFLMDQAT
jgi:hypothetical protein